MALAVECGSLGSRPASQHDGGSCISALVGTLVAKMAEAALLPFSRGFSYVGGGAASKRTVAGHGSKGMMQVKACGRILPGLALHPTGRGLSLHPQ